MFTIGNLAKKVGVRAAAIRYYENLGVLPPCVRSRGGYRIYSDDAVNVLQFVRRAQSLGITLKEIKPLLNLAAQGQQPCSHVKVLARNHLGEIEQKVRELHALRAMSFEGSYDVRSAVPIEASFARSSSAAVVSIGERENPLKNKAIGKILYHFGTEVIFEAERCRERRILRHKNRPLCQ
jgi:MerR family copper efflux transcriptional regulator